MALQHFPQGIDSVIFSQVFDEDGRRLLGSALTLPDRRPTAGFEGYERHIGTVNGIQKRKR